MRPRGSTLVLALFVIAIIFVAGIGFLSQRRLQYESAMQAGRAVEALALAEAGIEDARVKMQTDWDFPPHAATDQKLFSYVETVSDSSGTVVGSSEITLDRSSLEPPQQILVVRSTGRLGSMQSPTAQRTVEVEIDFNPDRATYFQTLSWRDLGGL